MQKLNNAIVGKWRVVEMKMWDRDYIDLVVPGHITFDPELDGAFLFGHSRG